MGIEISNTNTPTNRGGHRVNHEPIDLKEKTFQEQVGDVFGSYKHVLVQSGLKETEENPDILIEPQESEKNLGVRITVDGNRLLVSNLLNVAPNELTTTVVQKALALGKITLPTQLQRFIQPKGMVGGDLGAVIMGRYVHITPEGEIWTPPQMMIPGPDTWHKVPEKKLFDLILPDWLHGGINRVSMNTGIEGGVLEGITWKKQKIRIRPNGEITQVIDKAEVTIDKKEHINLVIPDCLIGKISFNGEPDRLPLFGTVGDIHDKKNSEYICIKPGGVVEKMGSPRPGGRWSVCSAEEIERLGKYPTQKEIERRRQEQHQERMRNLRETLEKK